MRATLPAPTKRDYRAVWGLTYSEIFMAFLSAAVAKRVTLKLVPVDAPLQAKWAVGLVLFGMGLALIFGRWPLSETGERLSVWAQRMARFYFNRKRRVYG